MKKRPDGAVDTEALYQRLALDIARQQMLPGTNPLAVFTHLISGYDSQYYGYLWSLVYSCDVYQHI